MSKDNRSLTRIVAEFRDWNSNLHASSMKGGQIVDNVDLREAFLTMHNELAAFMEGVLGWMQAREEGIPPMRVF